ncbi:MAG: hypothetical protein ACI9LM_003602 [Alteromonadaceae bacterium]|jgi:hypothetical protein
MSSLNVYLANDYLDKLNKKKLRREKYRALIRKKELVHTDLTSKNAQINNLEVNQ